jgi:squalene synthase HpnC
MQFAASSARRARGTAGTLLAPVVPDAAAVDTQAKDENFPVASWLLPAAVRADLVAVYGFARLTDEIGDEHGGDRLAALDWLESELERAAAGDATHPVMQRLQRTISAHRLTLQPMRDLIAANRQDQTVHRYETYEDLVGYCRLSANPVGRIVLAVLGASTPERVVLSDDVCTALQIVEHLQDVKEDLAQGRVYLPLEDLVAEGCTETDLAAQRAGPALRRVVALEALRARRLLASGGPLARSLAPRACLAVAGFAAGGVAALDAIDRAGYDVLAHRCRPRPARFVMRVAGVLASTPRDAARGGHAAHAAHADRAAHAARVAPASREGGPR